MGEILTIIAESSDAYEMGKIIGGIIMLVLFVSFPVLFVVSLIKTIRKRGRVWVLLLILSSILSLLVLGGVITAGAKGFKIAVQKAREQKLAGETRSVLSEDGLVSLEAPGNWKEAPDLSAEADLGLMDVTREQYCLVMNEATVDFDIEQLGGLKGYGDLILELMSGNLKDVEPGEWKNGKGYHGLPFRSIEVRATASGVRVLYLLTVFQTEDYFHQLLQWSIPSRWEDALPVFEEVKGSFHLAKSVRPVNTKSN